MCPEPAVFTRIYVFGLAFRNVLLLHTASFQKNNVGWLACSAGQKIAVTNENMSEMH